MARKPSRQITVDGEPMVVLALQDFENLDAVRRQLGSQAVRMRTLREALLEAADHLEAVGDALRRRHSADRSAGGPDVDALLAALPEQIDRARRSAGTAKRRPKR